MTEKLYDLNSYIFEFDATVVSFGPSKKGTSSIYELVLDRTAFFPEGGGQSSDTGDINGFNVCDVKISGDIIVHFISGEKAASSVTSSVDDPSLSEASVPGMAEACIDDLFQCGLKVHGTVNRAKRFERMQQHSGEHLLSGFVSSRFGYRNTGFHLSDNGTTVDFDGTFTDEDIVLIENRVNDIILKNIPSHIYYPEPEELKKLSYRSKKELEGPVRIVEYIGDDGFLYDRCACCAPHVNSTIEIGLFKILSYEHFKGGTRMEIACGQRLLEEMRIMQQNIKAISRLLSVKPKETAAGVDKLNESYKALKFNTVKVERDLLELKAHVADEPVLFLESADTANIRLAVNSLTERFPGRYCCAFAGDDTRGYNFIIACLQKNCCSKDEALQLDCTALLLKMKNDIHASGGGSTGMIQGRISDTQENIRTFLNSL